jgi:hypothetical protein
LAPVHFRGIWALAARYLSDLLLRGVLPDI